MGTKAQFAQARKQVLTNQVEEQLRVLNADRIIAERWGLDLIEYDAITHRVRALVEARQPASAAQLCQAAAAPKLNVLIENDRDLSTCRSHLDSAQAALGKANRQVYFGAHMVRAGRERYADPFLKLCQRYDTLRWKYLLGQKANLVGDTAVLAEEVRVLLDATRP
jgi:hypothetical protein